MMARVDSISLNYSQQISKEGLKKHLLQLTSDEFEGREVATPGQDKAADYIKNEFIKYKISPCINDMSYYQEFELFKESFVSSNLVLGDQEFVFGADYYCFPKQCVDLDLENSEVVFAGYGIEEEFYNDFDGIDVNDKVVILLRGMPRFKNKKKEEAISQRSKEIDEIEIIEQKGVRAILIIDNNLSKPEYRKKLNHMLEKPSLNTNDTNKYNIPLIYISKEKAEQILSRKVSDITEYISKKGKPQSFETNAIASIKIEKQSEKVSAYNVLAYIEGTDDSLKDELITITAHYDHLGIDDSLIYYGADDNASGTSAIIEIAKAFALAKQQGKGIKRSVLVMAFTGEEKGLLGSKHYVANPVFPLENTVTELNIDMIGRIDEKHIEDSNYVYIIGSDMLSSELHRVSEEVQKEYSIVSFDYTYNSIDDPNKFYYRSDHYNFAKNNIPSVFYFNGVHDDYHKPSDTPDKISFDKMEKITRLIFLTAWELGNRDSRVKLD